ncbi:MAG: hypothetical protein NTV82_12300 [Candidatus Aminicenantes bacterium]|nr:hypothetical protein [Candidatus Aminicenantes bacterium]
MYLLTLLVTFPLSLFGYSLGIASRAGKVGIRQPGWFDIGLILVVWAAIGYSRSQVDFSPLLFLFLWVAVGMILGLMISLVKFNTQAKQLSVVEPQIEKRVSAKHFQTWRKFMFKIGTFQSQVFLGIFFLIVFGPVALVVKAFSDQLHIKRSESGSNWVARKKAPAKLEDFKRQF